MTAKAPDFRPGDVLPGTKYRIVKQIGAGGMGVVYQVEKPPSIMGVLKLMSSDLTGHEEFRTRFLDEVRVLAQLDHPNIVKVFDYDKLPDGTPFYVMELLHGRTVRDVLATMGTLPPRVAFEVTRQLCEALHAAHTHDIPVVHRDIKPENIFLHAPRHGEPVVKLIDFGVVAMADRAHDGAFVGTWKYAAPEQIRGERATAATDLYAVGLVLYEMLCGIGPFEEADSGSLVSQAHLKMLPPPVSKFAPWVPPSIVQLIASSLAKEPRQRPRDAYAFAERLFELEWANDGKDPRDQTSEGPLSRILSTAGGSGKPSSKNMVAVPPRDRLGNVPLIGVPEEARRGGPTAPGMGGDAAYATMPGEDALLAGLIERQDVRPRSKKERESGPSIDAGEGAARAVRRSSPELARGVGGGGGGGGVATLDAPPSAPVVAAAADVTSDSFSDGTTRRLAGAGAAGARSYESDTFASQESDARRAPRKTSKLAAPIALALLAVIGVISFVAYRGRAPVSGVSATMPPAATATATTAQPVATGVPVAGSVVAPVEAAVVNAPAPVTAQVMATPSKAGPTGSHRAKGAAAAASTGAAAAAAAPIAAPAVSVAPAPVKPVPTAPAGPKDESFVRGL
jgi:serine/threonine-protein kinase